MGTISPRPIMLIIENLSGIVGNPTLLMSLKYKLSVKFNMKLFFLMEKFPLSNNNQLIGTVLYKIGRSAWTIQKKGLHDFFSKEHLCNPDFIHKK